MTTASKDYRGRRRQRKIANQTSNVRANKTMTYDSATHFLNVDLDISSKTDLQPLVTALGRQVIVLYAGRSGRTHRAHLELARTAKTPDAAIRWFCALIETLSASERRVWDGARIRDFNIGVQAATQPYSSEFLLDTETLGAAHELGARIVLTVYAPAQSARRNAGSRSAAR